MSHKIQDIATMIFIASVAILTLISLLGIWDILDSSVIYKSFSTIGIIGFAALVASISSKFLEKDISHS